MRTAPSTTTSDSPATFTSTAENGIRTPQPIQPGMLSNCNKFHWVSHGNSCDQIASFNGISLADFVRWNPTVRGDCSGMWAEVNICVGVVGGQTTTAASLPTATTKPPCGVQTP